jgi:hypothetical protein
MQELHEAPIPHRQPVLQGKHREVILGKRDWIREKEMYCIESSQQIFKYLDQQLYLSKRVCDQDEGEAYSNRKD